MSPPDDKVEPFSVVRAGQLPRCDEDRRWLVDHLWARGGVGILGGPAKSCKSWLGLDIALSLASGTACLGSFAVDEPATVLVYMAEDAGDIVEARLQGLCRHRGVHIASLPLYFLTAPRLRLDVQQDRLRLAETVRWLQPRLLLLDPFVRMHRCDENHAGDVSGLLAYLRWLQRKHDLAILVVHHTRKNGASGQSAGLSLRGSGDFHAWGDHNLYLRRKRDHLELAIEHRAAPSPDPLALVLAGEVHEAHLQLLDPSTPNESTAQHLDDQVVSVLASAAEPLSRSQLRRKLHVRNQRLGHALGRLAEAGKVQQHAGRWTLS